MTQDLFRHLRTHCTPDRAYLGEEIEQKHTISCVSGDDDPHDDITKANTTYCVFPGAPGPHTTTLWGRGRLSSRDMKF